MKRSRDPSAWSVIFAVLRSPRHGLISSCQGTVGFRYGGRRRDHGSFLHGVFERNIVMYYKEILSSSSLLPSPVFPHTP